MRPTAWLRQFPRSALRGTAVAALLALTACGGGEGAAPPSATPLPGGSPTPSAAGASTPPSAAAPTDPPAAPSDPAAPAANAELFAFTAPTVTGGQLEGSEYAGRDVAVWFWAPW